ncbi:MAG: hypothetical protein M1542_06845 [Thermotogae bacterium]|nr:hypothetical protein [Thermotogota bacterium]MCL5032940.1 hypothetical protein [Thermotogota bacterium]
MKILFKNANVIPITSKPFKGDVLIEDGKIKSTGKTEKTRNDVEVIDLDAHDVRQDYGKCYEQI